VSHDKSTRQPYLATSFLEGMHQNCLAAEQFLAQIMPAVAQIRVVQGLGYVCATDECHGQFMTNA
jgi:hypothetical protein